MKILFVADNHYDTHGGRALSEELAGDYDIEFHEDDPSCLNQPLVGRVDLLTLTMISGACEVPMPSDEGVQNVRDYVEAGGNLFLQHSGSAAFWQCDWWRPLVGFRWVRGEDPDGFRYSTHPNQPYSVVVSKTRHALAQKLQPLDVPQDELYTQLEQTCPTVTLMETTVPEGTYPMCYACTTPYGGRLAGYLPGHAEDVVRLPGNVANCRAIIDYLLGSD
jgi:hypothetical protein